MCKILIRSLFMSATMAAVSAAPANAAYVVTFEQEGSNVVATGSGAIDLTDLTASPVVSVAGPSVNGGLGAEFTGFLGGGAEAMTAYYGATGPASFGTNVTTVASSSEGVGLVGIATSGNSAFTVLYIEQGYPPGADLPGSSTYDNQPLASLGLTPGVYEYTWGSGAHADSFTVEIGGSVGLTSAPVPEASTWIMMLMGFGGLGAGAFTRRRRARISVA
jgi:hypothetical protein